MGALCPLAMTTRRGLLVGRLTVYTDRRRPLPTATDRVAARRRVPIWRMHARKRAHPQISPDRQHRSPTGTICGFRAFLFFLLAIDRTKYNLPNGKIQAAACFFFIYCFRGARMVFVGRHFGFVPPLSYILSFIMCFFFARARRDCDDGMVAYSVLRGPKNVGFALARQGTPTGNATALARHRPSCIRATLRVPKKECRCTMRTQG